VTTGALPAVPRAVSAARPGGAAVPATGRHVLLAVLAALAALATGLLPDGVGVPVAVAVTLLAVAVGLVLLLHAGRASSHPVGWRWYTLSVAVGAVGALLMGAVLPWGQAALGSIPGQLIVVVAIGRMIERSSLRAARAQMAAMLALFVLADLLTLHSVYRLSGASSLLTSGQTVALFALLSSIALGTGVALAFITVCEVRQRAVGWLLFTAQSATALAGACSSIATGPGLAQSLACAAGVLGVGLLVVACHRDRPDPRPAPAHDSPGGSALGALLPHATALAGGSLLLLSVPITGRLPLSGTALGLLGLGALLAHHAASWRLQQQLTSELQRKEAHFRALVRGSADPVLLLDDQLRVAWVSPAITDLLGLDPEAAVGLPFADAVHPDDAAGLVAALSATHGDDETRTRTARVRHLDGRWRLIQSRVRDLRSDPDVGALVLYCRDVSAVPPQPAEPDLTAFSTTDPATGLPNRSALTSRLGTALRSADARSTALVLLGIDGLCGGDDAGALRELTTRFTRALRGADWLARSGVSEFAGRARAGRRRPDGPALRRGRGHPAVRRRGRR
jgi:PAS domain S-box-containing protein